MGCLGTTAGEVKGSGGAQRPMAKKTRRLVKRTTSLRQKEDEGDMQKGEQMSP